MTEESRGKRRKQANPRRNRVDSEQVTSLGSDGEDEVGLWCLEPQDCQESLDKRSLTPSEGTEEPGSPAGPTRPHCLSPGARSYWAQVEPDGEAGDAAASLSTANREGEQEPLTMSYKNSDSQNALHDLAQYEFLAQLRNHNGMAAAYYQGGRHDELPPAVWSPGAQHHSPEGAGRPPQACPFCHRMYQRGASLRDHIKYCQEREGGHMVCPHCGYTATHRAQMERHLAVHSQLQDKSSIMLDQGLENRKFKCLQCGKAFKYKHHLKEHLRIHSGEKPYECSNCKKRFSHSGSYSSHLSSKKCLSGGGGGGANAAGPFNGHSHSSYHHSLVTSPSAGGGRGGGDKRSPVTPQNQDNARSLGLAPEDQQDPSQNPPAFPKASDVAQLWDPLTELSLRASIPKSSTVLPYPYAGSMLEHMLHQMLHREAKRDEEGGAGAEGKRGIQNGGEGDIRTSPGTGSVEEERGAPCRWCCQLFPSVAVLLQHERYHCKMNREAAELPDALHSKSRLSPPRFLPASAFQDNSKAAGLSNGSSGNRSPLQKPSWHALPQQLLVAVNSPPRARHEARAAPARWSGQEKGSPGQNLKPSSDLASPRARKRVYASALGSPARPDLAGCPPELGSPQNQADGLWSAQDEPLDLSLPKRLSDQEGRNQTLNGGSSKGERREFGTQQLRRQSPTSNLALHQHPVYSRAKAPVFPGSLYNGFPFFTQPGLGLPGHDGVAPVSFSQPGNGPGFLPPIAYMMEADAEAALKKLHQDRQALMGEVFSRGALDYLCLMDEGLEGDGGPGRKRLKKTDEGLYACDICEKTFQKSSSLLRHKYEHTGKRPHECKICNKAFKHKHHLIEHSRLHSGEKPYQCDKCGKRFSHSGSYSQHMNHRYAYCSKDQDPDQDHDDMPFAPRPGSSLGRRISDETRLSTDETQTPHSFLSDSSLDGAADALKEEDEDGRARGEEVQEPPEHRYQHERNGSDGRSHAGGAESRTWDADEQSGESNKCEPSLDITDLPRIKT
ncbi:zinc finger E-box-binding homeobox 2-like [Betta splendens]|uniref:Zinc finger E-box-binding homeobox 2-like n=1 Tax=Betta splendens TaxID=158456 RepID=A0A6P7MLP5_BETSP|nr:zinc finger E-box-binding homeobox 2-like [Betta splendens]